MDLLMRSMGDLFTAHPLAALLPAACFLAAGIVIRSRVVAAVAAVWCLYAAYEWLMKVRILCSGECNIRIDLLVIYPALVMVSIVGVVLFARRSIQRWQPVMKRD
jgi:hypothetical protein